MLPSGNEKSLKSAVANMGPVSVYVDATSAAFQFYAEGVLNVPFCSSTELSHAMVIIGYGTLNGQDYWLVKNRCVCVCLIGREATRSSYSGYS